VGHGKKDFEDYHGVWAQVNPGVAPPSRCVVLFFVDENEDRAQTLGRKYISAFYHTAMNTTR